MLDVVALLNLVRSTFSNATFPKGVPPAQHQCRECDGIRSSFAEQAPFALPGDLIEHHFDSLPMLSPAAFHHFLPAYFAYAVESPNSLVAMFVWFSLSPEDLDDFYLERFGRFSELERAAIREVVEFLIERTDERELTPEETERARTYWRAA
jgi:uncharacterized protein DUF6714